MDKKIKDLRPEKPCKKDMIKIEPTPIHKEFTLIQENGCIIAIRCETCKMVSYNTNDIKQKYCAFCHKFHNDKIIFKTT